MSCCSFSHTAANHCLSEDGCYEYNCYYLQSKSIRQQRALCAGWDAATQGNSVAVMKDRQTVLDLELDRNDDSDLIYSTLASIEKCADLRLESKIYEVSVSDLVKS